MMSDRSQDPGSVGQRPPDGASAREYDDQPATVKRIGRSNGLWIKYGKVISGTVLAMFIAADVGVNVAHNTAAVVSRAIPFMDDRPFYFDPLGVVHDLERVAQ
jgi:hypothetical protein